MIKDILRQRGDVLVNVAIFCAEKLINEGAQVMTLSDSSGFIYDPDGFDHQKLAFLKTLKFVKRQRLSEYTENYPHAIYHQGKRPWLIKADLAFPCATQNELNEAEATQLVDNGCICVAEGANMPSTPEAIAVFQKAKILFAPGKASNAGGVATSGLEMSQNSLRLSWSREEVDSKLKQIMIDIHSSCVKYGKQENGSIDYVKGANLAGFVKVADAMIDQGVV